MKESALNKQCLTTLNLYGVFAWRNNTGKAVYKDKYGKKRLVPFGLKGSSDILGILPGRGQFLAVESKVETEQSEAQIAFQAAVEAHGGRYWLVRDVTELIELLQAWRRGD